VNLGVVFIIRNVSDRRGELERAGGLLNLPAQLASDGIELRRGELLNTGKVPDVSGGMKVAESWRFEIPFSSAAFSSSA
jgi:hypothetical protein